MTVFRRLFTVGLILVWLLAPRVVLGDLAIYNGLEIQGAHVVSEGAFFRFWMMNHYSQPVYVVINDGDPIYILPNGSANYNVIAPQISVLSERVTYTFKQYFESPRPDHLYMAINTTVLVLDSSYTEAFSLIVPLQFIIAIGLIIVVISFIIWQRKLRRRAKRSQEACPVKPKGNTIIMDKKERNRQLGIVQDFYSKRAVAHAGFVVTSMFGLFSMLQLMKSSSFERFMVLGIVYWLIWVFGLYSFGSFGYYASVAHYALREITDYDIGLIDKAKKTHNRAVRWFLDYKKGQATGDEKGLKYRLRNWALLSFIIVYLLIGLIPFLYLLIESI